MELADEGGQLGFEGEGLGDVGERGCAPQGDLAGVSAGLTNDEGGGGLGRGCRCRVALGQIRREVWVGPFSWAGEIPCAVINEASVLFFPRRGGRGRIDERLLCARDDGNIGTANNFEKTQGVADLMIAPVIARGYADAKDLGLRRLNE